MGFVVGLNEVLKRKNARNFTPWQHISLLGFDFVIV